MGKYTTAPTCDECGTALIRTSNIYLCCPRGHGKLVPLFGSSKPAHELPAVEAHWRRWCKWFDRHERGTTLADVSPAA